MGWVNPAMFKRLATGFNVPVTHVVTPKPTSKRRKQRLRGKLKAK